MFGMVNFLTYTVMYGYLGGDALNGGHGRFTDAGGTEQTGYYISGHFLHGSRGQSTGVPRWVWIYSYLHSTSIWPTAGVMMISMIVLARPHIIATMSESNWIQGPTFVAVSITLIAVFSAFLSVWLLMGFVRHMIDT